MMNLTSKIILQQLEEEYGIWSESRDFNEIGAETILSFWSEDLPDGDRTFLTDFIRRWNAAVETLIREQICAECRRFTHEVLFVEWKSKMVCQTCYANLKKCRINSLLDIPNPIQPATIHRHQPTLF